MQVVQLNPRVFAGSTLLHLAAATSVDKFPIVARLLLDADVDAVDANGNTLLHLVAGVQGVVEGGEFDYLVRAIVDKAHVDVVNKAGLTPLEVTEATNCKVVANALKHKVASLKCLASRALRGRAEEDYRKELPRTVEEFLKLHM